MSAAARSHEGHETDRSHERPLGLRGVDGARPVDDAPQPAPAPEPVEVRRNGGLAGLVGVLAAAVAIAWLGRATAGGGAVAWLLALGTAAVAAAHLRAFLDARTPLLVADTLGVRIRLGRTWRGLPWSAVRAVEHTPSRGPLRDGGLVVHPHDPDGFLDALDAAGRRRAALASRLHGAPVAVPLGLATRVVGAGGDLGLALDALAGGATAVVAEQTGDLALDAPAVEEAREAGRADDPVVEEARQGRLETHDPRPWLARGIAALAEAVPTRARRGAEDATDEADDPRDEADDAEVEVAAPVATATPAPARETSAAQRTEVHRDPAPAAPSAADLLPEGRELRRPGSVDLVEEAPVWGDRVRPIATAGEPVAPLVIDDFAVEPAADPVVGPELAAARTRLGLSVDQLAARTRIRPHVIESIEVDDFAPCGGDFYARGHLRTLARVLGVDVAPLLAAYDERYAHAPVDARRVFEAELATTPLGSIRGTRGGPDWSVLVAAFMTVVLAWSVVQLLLDSPPEVRQPAPTLRNGSGGLGGGPAQADPVDVVVSAVQGGATVEVRGGDGETVFSGDIAHGESRALEVVPPVQVRADDAGAVTARVDGDDKGRLGETGSPATQTYVVARDDG